MKNTPIRPLIQIWYGCIEPLLFLVSDTVFPGATNQHALTDGHRLTWTTHHPTGQR